MMKHKHYDCIVAWAEGKQIQVKDKETGEWEDLCCTPSWHNDFEYRIKPEPKPDVVREIRVELTSIDGLDFVKLHQKDRYIRSNLLLTFDGETVKLKSAEVI